MPNKTNWWKIQFNALLLGAFLLGCQFSGNCSPIRWNALTQADFSVYFTAADSNHARNVLSFLTETFPELTRTLAMSAPVRMDVFICPSQKIFDQLTGGYLPEWSEAVCLSHQNQIVLKSPNWSPSARAFRATVLHEVTHLVLAQRVNYRPIPTWLNEGLAVHFSGERTLASVAAISQALVTRSLIPLREIDDVLRFQRQKALLAYQESYSAGQFLLNQFGAESLAALLDAIQHETDFESAFYQIYQMRLPDFENAWLEHIRTKNRWDFMFEFGNYLWILMGILFVLAVLRVFLRNRQRRREWEREEAN